MNFKKNFEAPHKIVEKDLGEGKGYTASVSEKRNDNNNNKVYHNNNKTKCNNYQLYFVIHFCCSRSSSTILTVFLTLLELVHVLYSSTDEYFSYLVAHL
jgi:hypothetical protein